jgi:hypothetical protein
VSSTASPADVASAPDSAQSPDASIVSAVQAPSDSSGASDASNDSGVVLPSAQRAPDSPSASDPAPSAAQTAADTSSATPPLAPAAPAPGTQANTAPTPPSAKDPPSTGASGPRHRPKDTDRSGASKRHSKIRAPVVPATRRLHGSSFSLAAVSPSGSALPAGIGTEQVHSRAKRSGHGAHRRLSANDERPLRLPSPNVFGAGKSSGNTFLAVVFLVVMLASVGVLGREIRRSL